MKENNDIARRLAERQQEFARQKSQDDQQRLQQQIQRREREAEALSSFLKENEGYIPAIKKQMDDPDLEFILSEAWKASGNKTSRKERQKVTLFRAGRIVDISIPVKIDKSYPKLFEGHPPRISEGRISVKLGNVQLLLIFGGRKSSENSISVKYGGYNGDITIEDFKVRMIDAIATIKIYGKCDWGKILGLTYYPPDNY